MELKPCPFCGAKAKLQGEAPGWYGVTCTGFCPNYFETKEGAIEYWNRRPEERLQQWEQQDRIRTLETMTKNIKECLACASTWYDDGFTAECPQCRVRRLEKENKVLSLKARSTLANNLCPDHRDKQAGKPCLACEVERLKRKKAALVRRYGESMAKVESLETELEEWQAKTMKARMEAAEFEVAFDKEREARADLKRKVKEVAAWIEWMPVSWDGTMVCRRNEAIHRLRAIVKEGKE